MKKIIKAVLHSLVPAIVVLLVGSLTAFAAGSLTGRPVTDPLFVGTIDGTSLLSLKTGSTTLLDISSASWKFWDGTNTMALLADTGTLGRLDIRRLADPGSNTTTYIDLGGSGIDLFGGTSKPVILYTSGVERARAEDAGFRIGGSAGTAISVLGKYTATLDFVNQVTPGCEDLAITTTGTAVGDGCVVSTPSAGIPAGSLFTCDERLASGFVNIRHCCITANCNPGSATYTVTTFEY